jgi:FAD/FMN-containing dehydrogenase
MAFLPLPSRLVEALGGDHKLLALPSKRLYQFTDVKRRNLGIPITPAAITYPKTAEQVAAVVKCAVDFQLRVQARSGGHSFGNYCRPFP